MNFLQIDPRFSNNFSEGLFYFIAKFSVLNARADA